MTLIPVSNISVVGVSDSTDGASRWIGQRSVSSGSSSPRSIGSPSRLKIRPSVARPTGTEIGAPGVDHLDAAGEAVGRVHRDRADAVVAEVLLHLADQVLAGADLLVLLGRGGLGTLDDDRVVDLRQLVGEHRLDHDALDLLDPPDVAL